MALDIIRAILIGALPVALCTFVILQWSISTGRMSRFSGTEGLWHQHKANAKAAKKKREDPPSGFIGDIFHKRVMSFGGGFYGTMAVLTYVLIETIEIWQFVTGMADPDTWINKLGLGLLIEFFVNSIMNMVAAFIWFDTLPRFITVHNGLIWLAATYAGYLAGLRLTAVAGDVIWEKIRGLRPGRK